MNLCTTLYTCIPHVVSALLSLAAWIYSTYLAYELMTENMVPVSVAKTCIVKLISLTPQRHSFLITSFDPDHIYGPCESTFISRTTA